MEQERKKSRSDEPNIIWTVKPSNNEKQPNTSQEPPCKIGLEMINNHSALDDRNNKRATTSTLAVWTHSPEKKFILLKKFNFKAHQNISIVAKLSPPPPLLLFSSYYQDLLFSS